MTLAPTLPPGTVGLSTIDGRTGAFVKLGQWFMGANRKDARWSHVFLIGEGDTVYEAMPPGLQRNKLSTYLDDLAAGDEVMFIGVPLTDQQRKLAVLVSEQFVTNHTGYSFLSYLYVALRRIGVRTNWLRERIGSIGDMQCAQSVDVTLTLAGFHLWDDGRAWQDLIPADYAKLVREDDRLTVIDTVKVTV